MKKAITNRLKSLDAGRLPLGASSGEILLLLLDLNIFPFFDRPLDFRGEDGLEAKLEPRGELRAVLGELTALPLPLAYTFIFASDGRGEFGLLLGGVPR